MRFHTFLLKYGEIGIKGKNRYLFEDALVRQIRFAPVSYTHLDVYKRQGCIYITTLSIWAVCTGRTGSW